MPDISKCFGNDCPLKEKCFRYTCKPDELWQSYNDFKSYLNEDKTDCEQFISNDRLNERKH